MCPVCVTSTLTLIVGSVTATGGLTVLAAKIFRKKIGATSWITPTNRKENENESSGI